MVSTPTPLLGFEKQGQNDNPGGWWLPLNEAAIQLIEDAITKASTVATTGGDATLVSTNFAADTPRNPIIRIGVGQTLLSNVRIVTTRTRLYYVTNETAAGAFTVAFGGSLANALVIPRGCGVFIRVHSDLATTYASAVINLATGKIDGQSLASGAFLLGANNLSDVANAATSRSNLGLAIGSQVQAWAANLDAWAALATSAKQNQSANLDGWSADNSTRTMTIERDNSGTVLPTGIIGDMPFDFACEITGVTLLADQTGSCVVDIWKDSYANYPPLVGDTITAAAKPTITTAIKSQDTTLTGWTKIIAAGDILRFNLDSVTSITRLAIALKLKKF